MMNADISIENIMVPVGTSELIGGLTSEDRRGTLVDWNLSFTADGASSNRAFRSGTIAFMARALLEDEPIARRTLAHDMESFFLVIIWIATLDYEDEAAFHATPLAATLLDRKKTALDIVYAKSAWFDTKRGFRKQILEHFQPFYLQDSMFMNCLSNLRRNLFTDDDSDPASNPDPGSEGAEDSDLMKEGLFRRCMKEIDNYLGEKKGCDEMQWIDFHAPVARARASGSCGQERNKDRIMPC